MAADRSILIARRRVPLTTRKSAIPWGSRSCCTASGPWARAAGTCCSARWPCCLRSPRVCSSPRASAARCRSSANTAGSRSRSTGAGRADRCTSASTLPVGRCGRTGTARRSWSLPRERTTPTTLAHLKHAAHEEKNRLPTARVHYRGLRLYCLK